MTLEADGRIDLIESTPAFSSLFPTTRYFEVDSQIAGARFAAWVTPPAGYDADKTKKFPIVYQLDGNLFFPATARFHAEAQGDPMSPQIPFILVSVGYSERESGAWQWLRVRDLNPPGEPVTDLMNQALEYSVEAGQLTRDDGDRYLAMFANTSGDKFLGFLENELHPLMEDAFRIDTDDVGLWGSSYGGLFTTYVAIQRSKLFKKIGASSPGIIAQDSQIFKLYRQAIASARDYSDRHLHITLGARELMQSGPYQWLTARGTSELLAQTAQHPLPGLQLSTELIALETHITGAVPGWFSFLRSCYPLS